MRIGIDIDGVLANFDKGFAALLPACLSIPLGDPSFPPVWDWPQHCGATEEEVAAAWRAVRTNKEFWLNLDPLPGAERALARLSAARRLCDVYFVTHRMGVRVKMQTETWLCIHGFPLPTVLLTSDKAGASSVLRLDHYIDDKATNLVGHPDGTTVWCADRPHNRVPLDRVVRVSGIEDFLDRIHVPQLPE